MPRFHIAIATLFTTVFVGSVLAVEPSLPVDWRIRSKSELAEDPSRSISPTRFSIAIADFNGDGIDDQAYILISTKYAGEALWVYLSDGNKGFTWTKLDEIQWDKKYASVPIAMGVDVVKPGVIAYGCVDGAKKCNFGNPTDKPKLKLRDPALGYVKLESAASMFYWSKTDGSFLRVWRSD